MTLYECKPMNARISKVQCKKNRMMTDNLSLGIMKDARCKGCPGLGEPSLIDLEEIMGTPCEIAGCTKRAQKLGKCKAHLNGSEPRKSHFKHKVEELLAADMVVEEVEPDACNDGWEVIITPEPPPPVTESEIHIVNRIDGEGMKGLKLDQNKTKWYAMPLEIVELLAEVFSVGERKYETFNCLQPFDDGDRRFYDAAMRHLKECQIDPLARDAETGCYHGSQAAWNLLLRTYHADKAAEL